MPTDRTLVVADDLTGATDTGHSFAARGYRTVVRLDSDFDAPRAAVVVVDTESRYLPATTAATRVWEAVESVSADVVYKKIDSTLRGNLGPEIEAAADAMNATTAAVAPAFPSNGRVTAGGYHLVDGVLVTETEAGNDPDSPVETAYVPELLRRRIDADIVHAGVERAATRTVTDVVAEGAPHTSSRVIVFDAVHDRHLDAIAEGVDAVGDDVLLVGSAGLAEAVRLDETPTHDPPAATTRPNGTVFGVVGSVNPRTFAQLDALGERQVVTLDAAAAVREPTAAAETAADTCLDRLECENGVVITAARARSDVDAARETAGELDLSNHKTRGRVEDALAEAATYVWDRVEPSGTFLTGGAVAKAVLGRLDAGGIELRGEKIAPGIPIGTVRGGRADATPLVTKAGAFGEVSAIADAFERLRRIG